MSISVAAAISHRGLRVAFLYEKPGRFFEDVQLSFFIKRTVFAPAEAVDGVFFFSFGLHGSFSKTAITLS